SRDARARSTRPAGGRRSVGANRAAPPTRSAPGPRARAPRRTARGRASARGAPYRSPRRPASDAMLTYEPWHAVPGLRHGFLGRSNGDGWDAAVAREGVHLPVRTARQVHGTRVEIAAAGPAHAADGLVTATPGQLVGVVTADCMPVLLVDRGRRVAAAVHAGWRGARSLHGVRSRLQFVSPRRSGRGPPAQLRGLGIAAARLEADPRYISGRDRTGNCTVRWPARAACRGRQSRRDKQDTHDTPRR